MQDNLKNAMKLKKDNKRAAILQRNPKFYRALMAIQNKILDASEHAVVAPHAVVIAVNIAGRDFTLGADVVEGKLDMLAFEKRNYLENTEHCAFYIVYSLLRIHNINCAKTKDATLDLLFEAMGISLGSAAIRKWAA